MGAIYDIRIEPLNYTIRVTFEVPSEKIMNELEMTDSDKDNVRDLPSTTSYVVIPGKRGHDIVTLVYINLNHPDIDINRQMCLAANQCARNAICRSFLGVDREFSIFNNTASFLCENFMKLAQQKKMMNAECDMLDEQFGKKEE